MASIESLDRLMPLFVNRDLYPFGSRAVPEEFAAHYGVPIFALEVLRSFSSQPGSLGQKFPNASEQTLASVDELLRKRLLLKRDMRCLITGCAHSGTNYIAAVVSRLGLDIGHETMGLDGVASWLMAAQSDYTPWGPSGVAFRFRTTLQQVRDPLETISSLQTLIPISWHFACAHLSCTVRQPLLFRCMTYYYHWNLLAERISEWTYRIENFSGCFEEFCGRLGLIPDSSLLASIDRKLNSRAGAYEPVNWTILERIDRTLTCEIRQMAKRYGYDI